MDDFEYTYMHMVSLEKWVPNIIVENNIDDLKISIYGIYRNYASNIIVDNNMDDLKISIMVSIEKWY
jgi:hypothetical protein